MPDKVETHTLQIEAKDSSGYLAFTLGDTALDARVNKVRVATIITAMGGGCTFIRFVDGREFSVSHMDLFHALIKALGLDAKALYKMGRARMKEDKEAKKSKSAKKSRRARAG